MIFIPKSINEPPCLAIEKAKNNGTYRCEGVAESLKNEFFNKCYICETKEIQSLNIEHFTPHKGDRDLMFDWQNLFYSCGHCNSIKGAKHDNILNCTIESEGVDIKIKYEIKPFPKEKAIITAMEESEKVLNTVALLKDIYNGTTEQKIIISANIRNKLLSEIRIFQGLLFDYFDEENNEQEKDDFRRRISRHLKASSNFTAFKRWIIRDNEEYMREFGQHFS